MNTNAAAEVAPTPELSIQEVNLKRVLNRDPAQLAMDAIHLAPPPRKVPKQEERTKA